MVMAVRWPAQSAEAASEADALRPRDFYRLCFQNCSVVCSDSAVSRLVRLAQLGDHVAIDMLISEDLLPETMRPDIAPLTSAWQAASEQCQLAYAVYAWRVGREELALQIWQACPHPEAAAQYVLATAADAGELAQRLAACPASDLRDTQLAVLRGDVDALVRAGQLLLAGQACLQSDPARAKSLLLAIIEDERPDEREWACKLLLALEIDPWPPADLPLLQRLAQCSSEGRVALGNYFLRDGQRYNALAQFAQAGLFVGGHRLVAMDALSQDMFDAAVAARKQEILLLLSDK